jgi:hypothetical protein
VTFRLRGTSDHLNGVERSVRREAEKEMGRETFGLRRRFGNRFYLYSKISPG